VQASTDRSVGGRPSSAQGTLRPARRGKADAARPTGPTSGLLLGRTRRTFGAALWNTALLRRTVTSGRRMQDMPTMTPASCANGIGTAAAPLGCSGLRADTASLC